ncbi:hypothetical protein [Agrobacterium tumefaciens]|uniref:Uncharacterized protein n=1 Tax=Agrobacterium tumefaciens TaxID=358 RepID=A0A176WYJ4_AGRTU|nr:hypothetical protein [Agrobacterium tumefaciens]OAE37637.1 hypothetical protein A7J57_08650 [Agrobacterium tumefaciens]
MWPFTSDNYLDQAVAQALPQANMQFGSMAGPSLRQDMPVSTPDTQPGGNRILNNPQLLNALARMGNAISVANDKGASFGGSLAAGSDAFLNELVRQQDADLDQRRANAQIAAYEASAAREKKDAEYGVRSNGFEGDIARARVILNDPMATAQQKSVAQAVVQTAERLQGSWDPVSGTWTMNRRADLGGQAVPSTQPSQAAPMETMQQPMSSPSPQMLPAPTDGGMLLPPPSTDGTPDAGLFQSTGNRKVNAALQEEAGKAEIAGRRAVNEGVGKVDADTFSAISNQTRTLAGMVPQLQRIETLAANTKTGGVGVARLELGKLFGLDLDGVPEAQAITAIQNAIGPSLRTPGSGASSDKDVAIFMSSIPTLMNTPGGIREINKTYTQLLDRKKEEERIARKLLREDGNLERFYDETEKLGPVFKSAPTAPAAAPATPSFDRSAIEAEMKRRMLK